MPKPNESPGSPAAAVALRPPMNPDVQLARGVRRLLAPNPSLMTGPGTNTYLIGERDIAVVDPGPAIEAHLEAILAGAERGGATIRWILVTHTHPDHSPGATPLARRTGAPLLGMPAPEGVHQDAGFVPDRVLADGESLATDEFELTAVHTPGHASNHLCYRHRDTNWLLTGDHVIDGSTVVIDPPDGDMRAYLDSLARIRALAPSALLPGHGERIDEPGRVIDWIIGHRLARERAVCRALGTNPDLTAAELVAEVYTDVAGHLHALAERSLLAHLIKLAADGVAFEQAGRWRLAGRAVS